MRFQKPSRTETTVKHGLCILTVSKVLNKFKLLQKNLKEGRWKVERQTRQSKKQLTWLRNQIKSWLLGKYFTLQTVRKLTLDRFVELRNISTAILSCVMRHQLDLLYKKPTMMSKPLTSEKDKLSRFSCMLADLIKTNKNLIFCWRVQNKNKKERQIYLRHQRWASRKIRLRIHI